MLTKPLMLPPPLQQTVSSDTYSRRLFLCSQSRCSTNLELIGLVVCWDSSVLGCCRYHGFCTNGVRFCGGEVRIQWGISKNFKFHNKCYSNLVDWIWLKKYLGLEVQLYICTLSIVRLIYIKDYFNNNIINKIYFFF